MTWAPDVPTEEEIEGFVEDLMAVTPEILGIDETIPGCEIIDMNPYGVPAGTLPRYIKVAIREYHQDVFYRGGIPGLSVGDFVSVTHFREGNRYEVTGAGGSGGSVLTLPVPGGQGWAIISDAVPVWIATVTPTWLGTHTWGSGFSLMPTDATGQDLGDATHRWDLHTQAVYFEGASGANVITVPDNIADALGLLDAGGLEYVRVVSTNANPYFLIDPTAAGAGVGIRTGLGTATPEGKLDVAYSGNVGIMTLLLGADVFGTARTNNWMKTAIVGAYHYTNAEEPLGMIYAFSSNVISAVRIGGGHAYCNAATEVAIYTAANRTTLTGTNRFAVSSTGAITVTGPSMAVPDGWWVGIGAAAERIVIDTAGYIVFRGCNVGIGLAIPNQKLTVEGTIDLKEQAAANASVAAYGQIWVKTAAPNELWFTDDAGNNVQLGVGGGALPAVAGAGYALVSDGVNSWAVDLTPLWLGTHTWGSGFSVMPTDASGQDLGDATHRWDLHTQDIYFEGATGNNVITIPSNVADAFHISDASKEYLKIITTTPGPPVVRFNDGGISINFEIEAIGVPDALQVRGSDGQITLGVLTAGFIKSSAGGVLSVVTEVALADLAGYAQGSIIRGGAADWEALVHPGAAGYALISDATDIVWDQTPAWTGEHSFEAGIAFTGASGANEITVPDNIAIALELLDAGGTEYMRVVSTNANLYLLIDPAAAGIKVGIRIAVPSEHLHIDETNAALPGPNVLLDSSLSDGSDYMGGLIYAIDTTHVGAIKVKELTANEYALNFMTWGASAGAALTTKMVVLGNGNIGVGTTTPATLEHLYSTADTGRGITIDAKGTSTGQSAFLNFLTVGTGAVDIGNAASQGWHFTARGNAYATAAQQNDLLIYFWDGSGWALMQYWDHLGNVGIGVLYPAAKCHIDQASTSAAIPVLTLDQADVSDGFINFIGSDRGIITGATNSLKSVRVELAGTIYRLALYVDA